MKTRGHTYLLIPTLYEARIVVEGTVVDRLHKAALEPVHVAPGLSVVLCGFGLVASAAHAAAFVHRLPEDEDSKFILVGAAGSFDLKRAPVGSVVVGNQTRCYGIGVGEGAAFRSAADLGWQQSFSSLGGGASSDVIPLSTEGVTSTQCTVGELLSVAAASANPSERSARLARYPEAVAEEMEGFGVALAFSLQRIPLMIVRGISNQVGDRSGWEIERALVAAYSFALELHRVAAGGKPPAVSYR